MKTFVAGQIASASEVNGNFDELKREIDALRTEMNTHERVYYTEWQSSTTSNYHNATIGFPVTFKTIPSIIISNYGGETNLVFRAYNISTRGCGVQTQKTDGTSSLGAFKYRVIIIGVPA